MLPRIIQAGWLFYGVIAMSFNVPFNQDSWSVGGDSKITPTSVELVHSPHQQGSVWSKTPVPYAEWTLEAVIKTAADKGSAAGSSGYSIWYTSKPLSSGIVHGSEDNWDGLAVMIDNLANGGSVRGHLSDGGINFNALKDHEKESLSLCKFDYRKASVPVKIRIGYSKEGFVVDVNGQKCFMSTEITLPSGYFGITANSDVSKDILSVIQLDILPGMVPDMMKHLPKHKSDANTNVQGYTQEQNQQQVYQRDIQEQSDSRISSNPGDFDKLIQLLQQSIKNSELLENKIAQTQSQVELLTDQVTSLNQARHGKEKSVADGDLALIKRNIETLRSQLTDFTSKYSSSSQAVANMKDSSNIWLVLLLMVPIQAMVVIIHHTWMKRKERREKFL